MIFIISSKLTISTVGTFISIRLLISVDIEVAAFPAPILPISRKTSIWIPERFLSPICPILPNFVIVLFLLSLKLFVSQVKLITVFQAWLRLKYSRHGQSQQLLEQIQSCPLVIYYIICD